MSVGLIWLRGAALFLATFTLIGIVAELRGRSLDSSLWWIDLRDLPAAVRISLLGSMTAVLYGWALRRTPGVRLRAAMASMGGLFALLATRDSVDFYSLATAERIHPQTGLPLSLIIALVMASIALAAYRSPRRYSASWIRSIGPLIVAAGAWAFMFPLAQMLFFGTTDYRRPADAAVIFGARVYADGQPSPLLAGRIQTGVELYQSGLVPLLVMSGGDGADGYNEARTMRDVAIAAGVDPAAVLIDPVGTSTEASVSDVVALLAGRATASNPTRIIAVSQAYHLPRIQLSFARAGLDVLTVPAKDLTPIAEMPLLVAREVPAFWAYYLRIGLG